MTGTTLLLSAVVLVATAVATRVVHRLLVWSIRRLSDRRLAGETTRWQWRVRRLRPTEVDYVTGLHILLEDRFGEGDDVEVTTLSGRELRGEVVSLGMFASRLVTDGRIHHVANRHMSEVTNHTQLAMPVRAFEGTDAS